MEESIGLSEEEFVNAYMSGVHATSKFLQSQGIRCQLAEEIAQDAWSRGWERRSELRERPALGHWINSIALNLARMYFRRQKFYQSVSAIRGQTVDIETAAMASEILARCKEQDRELLIRCYMEGYSSEELAHEMGIHPTTVRVRLLRAKRATRTLANYRFFSPAVA